MKATKMINKILASPGCHSIAFGGQRDLNSSQKRKGKESSLEDFPNVKDLISQHISWSGIYFLQTISEIARTKSRTKNDKF